MYQAVDAVTVRAAIHPAGLNVPAWPDLIDGTGAQDQQWRSWLEQIWSLGGLAEAIEVASPVLARQVGKVIEGRCLDARRMRRLVMAVARYVLRATGRATPFGLFAGAGPATWGPQLMVRWGDGHRRVAGPGAGWLAAAVTSLETCPDLLRELPVVASNVWTARAGRLVAASQQYVGAGDEGSLARPVEVSVRRTRAVEAALRYASSPIVVRDLAAKLSGDFPQASEAAIEAMLAELVRVRLLITSLRAPMTITDPLGYVMGQLAAVSADRMAQVADRVQALNAVHADASRHNDAPQPAVGRELRARMTGQMQRAGGTNEAAVMVDLRLDAQIVLPPVVAREAEAAAAALTRLTPHPSGLPAWQEYHGAFIERYGPGALVRLLEVVNPDTGLGFPATFQGSARTLPAPPSTGRDERLLALAYSTVLDGGQEIILDEQRVRDLAETGSEPAQVPPHAELFVQVHAASIAAVQQGDFRLLVTGASRAVGTTTGRFLDLFSLAEKDHMTRAYAGLSTVRAGALPVQISCPPVHARSEAVARAPAILPNLISVAEHRGPGEGVISLEDLAVSGDAEGLYLVWLSGQRIVEPAVLNAVEFRNFSHPLTRFLSEITRARAAVYMPFSWGTAASLSFLPRLRCGRTVLAPAQWNVAAGSLPGPAASWLRWHDAVAAWRRRYRVPTAVHLAETDNLLRLDLDQSMHLALLRAHLNRRGHAILHEAPGPDAYGWLDGHAHEICVPLTSTVPGRPAPPAVQLTSSRIIGSNHGHVPGYSRWLYVKVFGHPARHNDILARVPDLLAAWDQPPPWWFVRYLDPEPQLRLRLHLPAADAYGPAAHRAGIWLAGLRAAGLAAHMEFGTYYPETGRYGIGPAMAAAESVFAADSAAALAQITCTARSSTPPDALTAASLANIAAAFTGTAAGGMRWLASHIPSIPAQIPRSVHDQAMRLADPQAGQAAAHALPGGDQVITCWQQRAAALATYRHVLTATGQIPADSVLASLLHMHVIRMTGIDPDAERLCHHLARSAAEGWIARNAEARL